MEYLRDYLIYMTAWVLSKYHKTMNDQQSYLTIQWKPCGPKLHINGLFDTKAR